VPTFFVVGWTQDCPKDFTSDQISDQEQVFIRALGSSQNSTEISFQTIEF